MVLIVLISISLLTPFPAMAREPSLQEVQGEAVRCLGSDLKDMEGWQGRARWSAVLPRLQVGFDRDLKDVVSLTTKDSVSISGGDVFVGPNESNFDKNFNQGTSFSVRALWYLNEMIFNRDTLVASHEKKEWIRERTHALQEVTGAYLLRRRLVEDLQRRRDPPSVREKKQLLLEEALARLDAYTNGWFSREIGL